MAEAQNSPGAFRKLPAIESFCAVAIQKWVVYDDRELKKSWGVRGAIVFNPQNVYGSPAFGR